MLDEENIETWEAIESLVEHGDAAELGRFLHAMTPSEVARALSRLDEDKRSELLTLLGPEDAADLLEELTEAQGADLIEDLPVDQAAAIVDEMESDVRADLLGEMSTGDVEAILQVMDPEEAREARQLLTYSHDTAGGLMVTEYVSYQMQTTVGEVLADLHKNAEIYSDYGVQYAYVVSPSGTPVGVARLRDLIFAEDDRPLSALMSANPLYVMVDAPLEELEQIFDRYTFVMIPVVDEEGRLVGVVRRADAEEAIGERAGEAFMRFSGIISGEELRSMPAMERSLRRVAWLSINLLLSLVTASVIMMFEGTISKVVALAFFIPVIGNMSGCSGNQAVAVSIRELTLGLIRPDDFLRVLWKELQVGLLSGPVMGIMICFASYLLSGNAGLSVVLGLALALNTFVALALGGLIPLLFRRLRMDPALATPLMMTTISDICGYFLVLTFATAALHLLT